MVIPQRRYWIVVSLLLAAILLQQLLWRGAGLASGQVALQGVPYQVGRWSGVDQPLDQHVLDVLGLDAYLQRQYLDPNGRILWLYVGYYRNQRQGKGIHSPKHCYPGAGWALVEKGTESITWRDNEGLSIVVNRLVFQKDDFKQVIYYWYQSAGRIVHNDYAQRVYVVLDAILHGRTDGALVKVVAPVTGTLAETREVQRGFIKQIYPFLHESLSGE
jgi:EpsI family protein